MVINLWEYIPSSLASRQYTRWINQFRDFVNFESMDELLNRFNSNQEIEQSIFEWMQSLKSIPETESTINQKISALILFFEIHNIPFLSDRIINQFPNYPIYHDDYTLGLIYDNVTKYA